MLFIFSRYYSRASLFKNLQYFQCHKGQITVNFHSSFSSNTSSKYNLGIYQSKLNYSLNKRMEKALVLLAEGTEEMEAVITVDVLRRALINVTLAGLSSKETKCSRDVVIVPDMDLKSAIIKGSYDIVIIPGGLKGVDNFLESKEIGELLKKQTSEGKMIAAICAGPKVLAFNDILLKSKITSYPSLKSELEKKYTYMDEDVVVDGNLITSKGPGTAIKFALTIVKYIKNIETAKNVSQQLLIEPSFL